MSGTREVDRWVGVGGESYQDCNIMCVDIVVLLDSIWASTHMGGRSPPCKITGGCQMRLPFVISQNARSRAGGHGKKLKAL